MSRPFFRGWMPMRGEVKPPLPVVTRDEGGIKNGGHWGIHPLIPGGSRTQTILISSSAETETETETEP